MRKLLTSLNSSFVIVTALILLLAPLRFINLGYSEFQDDEKKAFIRLAPEESTLEFLFSQRKGPMQFFVAHIPYLITGDFRNELAQRLPFAFVNLGSVGVLYLLLKKLTNNTLASIFGCVVYGTNGFIVGFSRIAQYQNLNLLFSFLSLYFYSFVMDSDTYKALIKKSLLGTIFFCLSLLSHWDAIFYLVPTTYFFAKFILRIDLPKKDKLRVILFNTALGAVILLPFIVPYIFIQSTNNASVDYFSRRIGFSDYGFTKHKFIFELYNPYFILPAYLVLLGMSLLSLRKNFIYFLWFVVNILAIRYLMAKPGTHIYNYVLPIIFIGTVFYASTLRYFQNTFLKGVAVFLAILFAITSYYQSYRIFVDHAQEYPWEEKQVFWYTTKPYQEKEILTFGFPHFRDWKKINEFVLSDGPECGYISNEGKEISQIYMDIKSDKVTRCYYIVSVKRPFVSTRGSIVFPQAKKKYLVYTYVDRGSTLTRVYKIPGKDTK